MATIRSERIRYTIVNPGGDTSYVGRIANALLQDQDFISGMQSQIGGSTGGTTGYYNFLYVGTGTLNYMVLGTGTSNYMDIGTGHIVNLTADNFDLPLSVQVANFRITDTLTGTNSYLTNLTGTNVCLSKVTGSSAFFSSITGTNIYAGTLSVPSFVTPIVSCSSITGSSAFFSSITGTNLIGSSYTGNSAYFTSITGHTISTSQISGASAFFTSITGTNVTALQLTGASAFFSSLTGINIATPQLTTLIATGSSAYFNSITGYNVTISQLTGSSAFFTSITGIQSYISQLTALVATGTSSFFSYMTGTDIYATSLTGNNIYAVSVTGFTGSFDYMIVHSFTQTGVVLTDNIGNLSAGGYTPEDVANKSTDGTMAANSNTLYPSQQATKTYADTKAIAWPRTSTFYADVNRGDIYTPDGTEYKPYKNIHDVLTAAAAASGTYPSARIILASGEYGTLEFDGINMSGLTTIFIFSPTRASFTGGFHSTLNNSIYYWEIENLDFSGSITLTSPSGGFAVATGLFFNCNIGATISLITTTGSQMDIEFDECIGGGDPPNATLNNVVMAVRGGTSWGGNISATNSSIAILERALGYGNYIVDSTSQLWLRLGCQISGDITNSGLVRLKNVTCQGTVTNNTGGTIENYGSVLRNGIVNSGTVTNFSNFDSTYFVSGLQLTGETAFFNSITGTRLVSGSSHTGQSAFFNSITGSSGSFLSITGQSGSFLSITGTNLVSGSSYTGQSAFFNSITGYDVYTSQLTGQSAYFTSITGAIVTGTSAFFTSITGTDISCSTITGASAFFSSVTGIYSITTAFTGITGAIMTDTSGNLFNIGVTPLSTTISTWPPDQYSGIAPNKYLCASSGKFARKSVAYPTIPSLRTIPTYSGTTRDVASEGDLDTAIAASVTGDIIRVTGTFEVINVKTISTSGIRLTSTSQSNIVWTTKTTGSFVSVFTFSGDNCLIDNFTIENRDTTSSGSFAFGISFTSATATGNYVDNMIINAGECDISNANVQIQITNCQLKPYVDSSMRCIYLSRTTGTTIIDSCQFYGAATNTRVSSIFFTTGFDTQCTNGKLLVSNCTTPGLTIRRFVDDQLTFADGVNLQMYFISNTVNADYGFIIFTGNYSPRGISCIVLNNNVYTTTSATTYKGLMGFDQGGTPPGTITSTTVYAVGNTLPSLPLADGWGSLMEDESMLIGYNAANYYFPAIAPPFILGFVNDLEFINTTKTYTVQGGIGRLIKCQETYVASGGGSSQVGAITFGTTGSCMAHFATYSDDPDGRYDESIYRLNYPTVGGGVVGTYVTAITGCASYSYAASGTDSFAVNVSQEASFGQNVNNSIIITGLNYVVRQLS